MIGSKMSLLLVLGVVGVTIVNAAPDSQAAFPGCWDEAYKFDLSVAAVAKVNAIRTSLQTPKDELTHSAKLSALSHYMAKNHLHVDDDVAVNAPTGASDYFWTAGTINGVSVGECAVPSDDIDAATDAPSYKSDDYEVCINNKARELAGYGTTGANKAFAIIGEHTGDITDATVVDTVMTAALGTEGITELIAEDTGYGGKSEAVLKEVGAAVIGKYVVVYVGVEVTTNDECTTDAPSTEAPSTEEPTTTVPPTTTTTSGAVSKTTGGMLTAAALSVAAMM